MPKSTLRLIAVAILFAGFAGYSYSESIWFPPDPGTAPANNVAAPVNIGADLQIKNGALGVDTLSVTGDIGVTSASPQIKFDDSNSTNGVWWLHNNTYSGNPSRMHFLYDRSLNGAWDAADGNPVFIAQPGADVNGTQDEIITNGEVHAAKYCDASGNNCTSAANLGGGTYNQNILQSSATGWNGQAIWSYPVYSYASVNTYPVCFLTTNYTTARGDSDLTGTGGCLLNQDGTTWTLQAAADKRADTLCRASCLGN